MYNYSSVTLTPGMESLLNKGMGFVPVPSKVNISQIAADHKHFTRNMTWVECWFDKDEDDSEKGEKVQFPEEKKAPGGVDHIFSCDRVRNNGPG